MLQQSLFFVVVCVFDQVLQEQLKQNKAQDRGHKKRRYEAARLPVVSKMYTSNQNRRKNKVSQVPFLGQILRRYALKTLHTMWRTEANVWESFSYNRQVCSNGTSNDTR